MRALLVALGLAYICLLGTSGASFSTSDATVASNFDVGDQVVESVIEGAYRIIDSLSEAAKGQQSRAETNLPARTEDVDGTAAEHTQGKLEPASATAGLGESVESEFHRQLLNSSATAADAPQELAEFGGCGTQDVKCLQANKPSCPARAYQGYAGYVCPSGQVCTKVRAPVLLGISLLSRMRVDMHRHTHFVSVIIESDSV